MTPKIDRLAENFVLSEGPHWDEVKQVLYFVDIFGKAVHRYDPKTGQHTKAALDDTVSFIIPIEGRENEFLISLGPKLVRITWDGVSNKVSNIVELATADNADKVQFNDAKIDPTGRLWLGTMGIDRKTGNLINGEGSFYSFQNGKLIRHLDKVDISNGLAWNEKLNKFYYIDSGTGSVDQFDYDGTKGTTENRQTVFTFSKHDIPGGPDGMTIDADGYLWVANFRGSRVVKIDPRKPETLMDTIHLPAVQITSVAFGGANFEELYVTSARIPTDGPEPPPTPANGALYRVTNINAKGKKALMARI